MSEPPRIGFIFIGGAHHVLHSAPIAAELARSGLARVTLYVGSDSERAMVERVFRAYGDPPVAVQPLPPPGWLQPLATAIPRWSTLKLPRLYRARHRLACHDALVMSERTSTVLRRWLSPPPLLIHIPHGAGDRAKGFESRLRRFDLVIVAGEKDRRRMIAEAGLAEGRVVVGGPAKLAMIGRLAGDAGPLFANGRPTILYNPHFDAALGSWPRFGRRVIAALAGSADYNLVVAPHVRLFAPVGAAARRPIEALARPGQLRIDLGSLASSDMTYTAQADIYVGDVSSQAYEYAARPRPCVFLNAHGIAWADDPNYLFWQMGEVIDDIADLLPALARAPARFAAEYRAVQTAMTEQAYGADIPGAPRRAADIIAGFVATAATSQKRRIALSSADPISGQAPQDRG